ncbi:MAG: c-type cytochrome [Verrucomicrobiota bacterium]
MKLNFHFTFIMLAGLVLTAGAAPGSEAVDKNSLEISAEPVVFRFLGGDPERGQLVFGQLACSQCHLVKGAKVNQPADARLDLLLGEEVRFVKRYEDMITAITNPRHVMNERYRALLDRTLEGDDVEPFMPKLTESMTVQQLVDLVEFLDRFYQSQLPGYGG